MAKSTDHKEGKAAVKVVYFTSKTLADGSHPFLLRITKDRARKYIATGLSLHPKYWNEQKEEIRRSYPEPFREELLTALRRWEDKYAGAAKALAEDDTAHDAADVAAKAVEGRKRAKRRPLLAFMDELVEGMKAARQLGNAQVYRDNRNQLHRFIKAEYGAEDLPFDRITVSFCQRWENALRAAGVTEVSLSQRFRTLRAVLNRAIAEGIAPADRYPFARNVAERHKFSIGKFSLATTKRAISRNDVRKIEALETTNDRERLAQAVFVFSFYVGGINFVDLAQLRWSNLSTDAEGKPRLSYVRQKTGGRFSIRLTAPALALVETFRPFTHAGPDAYVFPILDPKRHVTPQQIKDRLNRVIGQVNADLKALGQRAGIATPLTTYVARHSFATALKRAGQSVAVISEAMGHKTEAVTAVYLDSFATETVDSAFESLV